MKRLDASPVVVNARYIHVEALSLSQPNLRLMFSDKFPKFGGALNACKAWRGSAVLIGPRDRTFLKILMRNF
jgi:hypothetical protein